MYLFYTTNVMEECENKQPEKLCSQSLPGLSIPLYGGSELSNLTNTILQIGISKYFEGFVICCGNVSARFKRKLKLKWILLSISQHSSQLIFSKHPQTQCHSLSLNAG